jgi:hypothetical protein
MKVLMRVVMAVAVLFALQQQAGAQTMTSTTGAINGTVTDISKGVMPGVTVNLSGPALMTGLMAVTEANGTYRFSNVPVGEYALTFELGGFGTVRREGIRVGTGFTATVNATLNPGGVAETVTVTGESPVVDVGSTSVGTRFSSEILAELPGSRDAWSVIALAPAVSMNRMDVGGSAAWTQQGYSAYGVGGGERNEVEGSGQMYYTDFSSFEEISVTAVGNTAEVGTPGVFSNFVSKTGGNAFHGNVYLDYENEKMEAFNIDDAQLAQGIPRRDANRLVAFRDFTADIGGYLKRDKVWFYGAFRNQMAELRFPTLIDDTQKTSGPVYTIKTTANLTPQHSLVGYYQHASKKQPNYMGAIVLPTGRDSPARMTSDTVWSSGYPNDVFKGEYSAVLSDALFLVVRAGSMYSNWYRDWKSDGPRIEDIGNNFVSGGMWGMDYKRGRPQANGALSYFKSGWGGTHNFKFGGEVMYDMLDRPFRGMAHPSQSVSILNNGVAQSVRIYEAPGLQLARMWAYSGYVTDSWQRQRATLNLGVRLDRFVPFLPAQASPTGIPYDRVDKIVVWNLLSPRVGGTFDLTGSGKTVLKANYGKYWMYPAADFAGSVNPNSPSWYRQYLWDDLNGNGMWDSGEEGILTSRSGGTASTRLDPNIGDQFQHQFLAYGEHEVVPNFGVRTGFVWNGRREPYGSVNVNRPLSAYNVPVAITDPGPDGRAGTGDDGATVTGYNLSAAALALPVVNLTRNLPDNSSDYYTWEITANRRAAGSWSLMASYAKTWTISSALGTGSSYTPNALINSIDGHNKYSNWNAKVSATLLLPRDVRLIPLIRLQSGSPFARTFSYRLNYGSATIASEVADAERLDKQMVLDLRAEKVFRAGNIRLTGMLDLYNILNSNVAQSITTTSGSSFLLPSTIMAPRVARVGFKLAW